MDTQAFRIKDLDSGVEITLEEFERKYGGGATSTSDAGSQEAEAASSSHKKAGWKKGANKLAAWTAKTATKAAQKTKSTLTDIKHDIRDMKEHQRDKKSAKRLARASAQGGNPFEDGTASSHPMSPPSDLSAASSDAEHSAISYSSRGPGADGARVSDPSGSVPALVAGLPALSIPPTEAASRGPSSPLVDDLQAAVDVAAPHDTNPFRAMLQLDAGRGPSPDAPSHRRSADTGAPPAAPPYVASKKPAATPPSTKHKAGLLQSILHPSSAHASKAKANVSAEPRVPVQGSPGRSTPGQATKVHPSKKTARAFSNVRVVQVWHIPGMA